MLTFSRLRRCDQMVVAVRLMGSRFGWAKLEGSCKVTRAAGRIQYGPVYHKTRSFAMDFTGLLCSASNLNAFYVSTFLE